MRTCRTIAILSVLALLAATTVQAYLTPGSLGTGGSGKVCVTHQFQGNGATLDMTVPNPVMTGVSVNGVLNARAYGAIGDGIYSGDGVRLPDGAANGTSFISATGNFTSAINGDLIAIEGAGIAGGLYLGTVTFINGTSATISPGV